MNMKHSKILKLLCFGFVLGMSACSHDDENEPVNNGPKEENTEKEEKVDNSAYNFYGAEVFTTETFQYGRFEARMKMAYAPGCISSMFLYYNDSYMGNGKNWNELDIEVIGTNQSGFQSNIITGTASSKVTSEIKHSLSYPVDGDYHVYVMEWTPDYVAWSIDGTEMRRTNVGDTRNQVSALVEKQSLRFNLWASKETGWVGKLNAKNLPVTQYIDYVKVSSYDVDSKSFTELWTDDFDSFNSSRWGRGNWAMDLVTERITNVVVEDGNLQLRLTKELKK
jgi:beta-glucanase (GH16 family)